MDSLTLEEEKKAEVQALAKKIMKDIRQYGMYGYFCINSPDFEDLKKLKFDTDKIKESLKGASYLDSVCGRIEEIVGI